MNEPETFHSIINRLTNEHHGWVDTDAGKVMKIQPALLEQLRKAVFGGMGGSGGSSFGSKPPMDAAAYDLLEEITEQATEALAVVDPHPTPYGHAEKYVSLWAGQTRDQQMFTVTTRIAVDDTEAEQDRKFKLDRMYKATRVVPLQMNAYRLASRWVEKIDTYFLPNPPVAIEAPCPMCKERYVYRQKDGQTVQVAALSFTRDQKTKATLFASCAAPECGAMWKPEEFERLTAEIGVTIDGDSLASKMKINAPERDIPNLYLAWHSCGYEGPAREDKDAIVTDLREHMRHAHSA